MEKAYAPRLILREFFGRKNVPVRLVRISMEKGVSDTEHPSGKEWEHAEEGFTEAEFNALMAYLRERYAERIVQMPPAVSSTPVQKNQLSEDARRETDARRIRFELVPGYPLPFIVHGLVEE